jgi:hypothetical protein
VPEVRPTKADIDYRHKVAQELALAAKHLREYRQFGLARQLDEVADKVYIGQLTERPVQ